MPARGPALTSEVNVRASTLGGDRRWCSNGPPFHLATCSARRRRRGGVGPGPGVDAAGVITSFLVAAPNRAPPPVCGLTAGAGFRFRCGVVKVRDAQDRGPQVLRHWRRSGLWRGRQSPATGPASAVRTAPTGSSAWSRAPPSSCAR